MADDDPMVKVTPPSLRRVVADPTAYTQVRITTGVFGAIADMCMTCGALLPTGITADGETPREAHTRFHAAMELTVQLADEIAKHLKRKAGHG